MSTASSKLEHSRSGLGVLAASKIQKSGVTARYYRTLVYHDRSSRKHTKKLGGHGVLEVNVARLYKSAL